MGPVFLNVQRLVFNSITAQSNSYGTCIVDSSLFNVQRLVFNSITAQSNSYGTCIVDSSLFNVQRLVFNSITAQSNHYGTCIVDSSLFNVQRLEALSFMIIIPSNDTQIYDVVPIDIRFCIAPLILNICKI